MANPRHLLGWQGEDAAAAWLDAIGWTILARRGRTAHGELDLVCRDPDAVLVGVEVRLRRGSRTGSALASVDRRRIGRLRATLGAYAASHGAAVPAGLRIDLVTVTPTTDGRWRLARHPAVDAW